MKYTGSKKEAQNFRVAVPAVEGLTGKHAIYLVTEGPEVKEPQAPRWGRPQQPQRPFGLYDFHGLAFTKKGGHCGRPHVPTVEITVDGKALNIPSAPILSTNQNGYTENNRYQVYAKLNANSVIKATSSDPSVKVQVGKIADGRATVKCTWNGVDKIFLIN